ncbi:MAG: hypothetical protein RIS63_1467 [Bacteroidota bacterium]
MDKLSKASCVVLVPVHKWPLTPQEHYSVDRTFRLLSPHYPCVLLLPERLSNVVSESLSHWQHQVVSNKYLSSTKSYSRMLMASWFYDLFISYEYMLLCQPDAMLISGDLAPWLDKGFSYVGAPWLKNKPKKGEKPEYLGVGNGGFSLRRIADFRRVLRGWRYLPNNHHFAPHKLLQPLVWFKHRLLYAWNRPPLQYHNNEDLFWGMIVPRHCEFFTLPTAEEALAFAFEAAPEACYHHLGQVLPLGCHAWEKFEPEFWRKLGSQGIAGDLRLSNDFFKPKNGNAL